MKIHYDLIGTIPAVEFLRAPGALDELILRYEQSRLTQLPEFGLMSPTDISLYVKETFKDTTKVQCICDGIAIEMAAAHFYGLRGIDFNSMTDLIDAIHGMDDDLRVK